jgi:L-Ala-D/L-Glu epimerase
MCRSTAFGLDPAAAPVNTFCIGIDTPEITRQKMREAEQFPVLKIKVGLKTDEPTIEAVQSVTKKPLRVDANEGWTDKERRCARSTGSSRKGLSSSRADARCHAGGDSMGALPCPSADPCRRTLSQRCRCSSPGKWLGRCECETGQMRRDSRIHAHHRSSEIAWDETMLGCMVSSSVSVTAAAHLSPLVDYADLDGNLLISNDFDCGVEVQQGKLILPWDLDWA